MTGLACGGRWEIVVLDPRAAGHCRVAARAIGL
jgi:hypothetical protein